MQLITNKISTGKAVRFEDFVKNFRAAQVKTASVKVAEEQEEADSSGQLDVEPLHQKGESTTMPKAGPSAKKDDGEKAASADTDPEKEGKDSGQPKAEGTDKFTNNVKFDPNDSSDEEKGIDAGAKAKVKVAGHCAKCDNDDEDCVCDCKDCQAAKRVAMKTAKKELPQALKDNMFKAKGDKGKKPDCDGDSDGSTGEDCKEDKKDASSATQFVKWANLDSKNKSFLTTYWRQLFGDDYVNALVADK